MQKQIEHRNHRIGRQMYGPVRANQRWKNRITGAEFTVMNRENDNKWRVAYDKATSKASHSVKERDIYKYNDKVSR